MTQSDDAVPQPLAGVPALPSPPAASLPLPPAAPLGAHPAPVSSPPPPSPPPPTPLSAAPPPPPPPSAPPVSQPPEQSSVAADEQHSTSQTPAPEQTAATTHRAHTYGADPLGGHSFTPLRSEPPPRLFATWWLRYVLALSQLVGIAVVLLREYDRPGGMDALFVVTPHAMAAAMLVGWSALAMIDAARLVPATRYHQPSRAWVAVILWLGAFAAPAAAYLVIQWVRDRFAESSDDLIPIAVGTLAVMLSFVLVWLPFRYHVRQAHRIGAPVSVVAAWFWLPLLAVVGVLAAMALGLHDLLADGGFTDVERMVQVGVLYGVPALVFAMSTWRATTVFDEVIELRWLRWRAEWEQTLTAFAAQPPPGPEASPVINRP